MSKRYRLLKDLPFVKAGCIYFKDDNGEYLKSDKTSYLPLAIGWKHERFAIHSDYVENNPEWFIEEHLCKHCGAWTSQPDEECYKAPQPKEDKPEWEIVAVHQGQGSYTTVDKNKKVRYAHFADCSIEDALQNRGYKIYSVKRISDGEVFSVGDEVEVNNEDGVYKIVGWEIFKTDFMDTICATFVTQPRRGLISASIDNLKKSKPKEELKEPERVSVKVGAAWGQIPREYLIVVPSKEISSNKYDSIKQAIEQVLNDEKIYSKFDVDVLMEDAFNAARIVEFKKLDIPFNVDVSKYPQFSDYQSSLK